MLIERPGDGEYAPFYGSYVARVTEPDLLGALARQPEELRALAARVPPEREQSGYAPGKWSVSEVFGHIGDVERVFGYRAFCISRGERTALPGFEENDYVANSGYAEQPLSELVAAFSSLRESNLAVLRRLDDARWALAGNANGSPVSVRALAFIMVGHVRHHVDVLQQRYGVG